MVKKTILATKNLVKTYKNQQAVDQVSMTVNKGDIYGFIGKNGAGKTTFIRLLTELIQKSSGEIFYGTDSEEKIKIGAVIEGPVCYPYLSAKDNLTYIALQKGIRNEKRIADVLEFVGLENTENKKFQDFSLGMKQRLGIAVAILDEPEFLILDEPINGLDPQEIVEIRHIIQRLNQENGTTVFISSHILTELSMVATRYGIINNGQLIQELDKQELEQASAQSIILETPNNQKARACLLENEYEVSLENNQLLIQAPKNEMEKIAKILFASGLYAINYFYQEENLEDYYLHLVEGGNK